MCPVSPDGRWVVTASTRQSARVWDRERPARRSPNQSARRRPVFPTVQPGRARVVTASASTRRPGVGCAQTANPLTEPFQHG